MRPCPGSGDAGSAQFKSWRHLSGDDWIQHGEAMGMDLGDPGDPPKADPYEPYGGTENHPDAPGVPPGDSVIA